MLKLSKKSCCLPWQISRRRVCVTAALSLLLPMVSDATETPASDDASQSSHFTLQGFGTAGLAKSTNGDVEYIRSVSQPKGIGDEWTMRNDSLFGLQGRYRANDALDFVAQVVDRYDYSGSFEPDISALYARYEVNPSLSFRLGRIETEFLMNADSRMVGYSYLPVRPPADYFAIVPFNYVNGGDARYRYSLGDGVINFDFIAGKASEQIPQYDVSGSTVFKSSLGYSIGEWSFKYIYAQAQFNNDIPDVVPLQNNLSYYGATAAADALSLHNKVTRYHSLGGLYDDGTLQAQVAVGTLVQNSVIFEDPRFAYALVGYRFGKVTPFVGYSFIRSTHKSLDTGLPDIYFGQLNGAVNTLLRSSHIDRETFTVGSRWDIYHGIALKGQVDFVNGSPDSYLLMQHVKSGWNGNDTVFSLSIDFVF